MSKELDALKRIRKLLEDKYGLLIYVDDLDIIEKSLKRLEVYETFGLLDEKYDDVDKLTDIKGKLTYVDRVMDTQERLLTSVSADEIRILSSVLNSQIRNLKKKLKALEIIKAHPEQLLDIIGTDNYNEYLDLDYAPNQYMSEENYYLVKEVLL